MKRLRGIEAVGARIAQRADDVEKLHHRTRPAVQQDQRPRGWLGRFDVQEMHRLAVDLGAELRVGVELGLLGAPVELTRPVVGQLPEVINGHPALPGCARQLLGPAGRGQPGLQVGQVGVGNRDTERLECQLRGHPAIILQPRRTFLTSREFAEISTGTERSRALAENLDTDVTSGVRVKHEVFVVLCGTCPCPGGTC